MENLREEALAKLDQFNKLPLLLKVRSLGMADELQRRVDKEFEILKSCYKEAKWMQVESILNNIAVIRSNQKNYQEHPFFFCIFLDGQWKSFNLLYATCDLAILGAFEVKYKAEQNAGIFAAKLLNMEEA